MSWFLQMRPVRLETKYIHIKNRVENYLNAAFYNHAAVALHNWKVRVTVSLSLGAGWDAFDHLRKLTNFTNQNTLELRYV